MSTLGDLRTELADALAPLGITTYTHIPARMSLPGVFVMAGEPYVSEGQTLGERLVRFQAVLAAQKASNIAETAETDELIEKAVIALESDAWTVEEIAQPSAMDFHNTPALVVVLTVTTTIPAFN